MRLALLGAALLAASACSTSVRLAPDFDRGADPCANVVCEPTETCVEGSCQPVDPCADVACEPGDVCVEGSCVNDRLDADGDGYPARSDCDDHDPDIHPGTERPCSTDCGEGQERCEPNGRWSECSAPTDCRCQPGQERREPCRNCGERLRRCTDRGTWGILGPCQNEQECEPGSTLLEPCGDTAACGQAERICDDRCRWGDQSDCRVNSECEPGGTLSEVCGLCGVRTQVCSDACLWDAFGACEGEGPCSPGDTSVARPCGECGGSQTQTCGNDCRWEPWSACQEPGNVECAPGEADWRSCNCLEAAVGESRLCQDSCTWGPWEGCPCACALPAGGPSICETEHFTFEGVCGGLDTIATCGPDGGGGCDPTWSGCIPEG